MGKLQMRVVQLQILSEPLNDLFDRFILLANFIICCGKEQQVILLDSLNSRSQSL